MKDWTVWIKDFGTVVVTADDIDGAYLVAAKQYGCSMGDILTVFWQANNAFVSAAATSGQQASITFVDMNHLLPVP